MAGMFYSLQEAAEKLRISEDAVKELAKNRKLREFRDGENIMFKIDEVDTLALKSASLPIDVTDESELASELGIQLTDNGDSVVTNEDLDLETSPSLQEDDGQFEATDSAEDLDALLNLSDDDLDAVPPVMEDTFSASEPEAELALEPELELSADDDIDLLADEPQIDFGDTQIVEDSTEASDVGEASIEALLQSSDSAADVDFSSELGSDMALTSEGLNVLGDTDGDYQLTDDTMAETLAGLGATGEASLEEIEDDVNLDSFGSGSGLLDLSLQADDTSLGGILDEIYTNEDDDFSSPDTEQATASGMTDEVDDLAGAEGAGNAEEMALVPMSMAVNVAEMAPDATSNAIGAMQFLSLAVLIYTALVAVSASKSAVLPSVAVAIKSMVWIVMGGLVVVALIWAGVGFAKGGSSSGSTRTTKARKDKRVKAKGKREKPVKEKKAKKGLFAKKK